MLALLMAVRDSIFDIYPHDTYLNNPLVNKLFETIKDVLLPDDLSEQANEYFNVFFKGVGVRDNSYFSDYVKDRVLENSTKMSNAKIVNPNFLTHSKIYY